MNTKSIMPKVRRQNFPRALFAHLLERIQQRDISKEQLGLLNTWLDGEPEVPAGKWFKAFPGMFVCGEGELVKTFLRKGQVPDGIQMR